LDKVDKLQTARLEGARVHMHCWVLWEMLLDKMVEVMHLMDLAMLWLPVIKPLMVLQGVQAQVVHLLARLSLEALILELIAVVAAGLD
jgi:hypothetical protein